MPVKKVGDVWEVNGTEYETEAKAEAAYTANLALKFGVTKEQDIPKSSKKKSKKSKKSKEEQEDEDILQFGHD